MKKNYPKLLLAFICLFTFSALRAQTYTVGDITAVSTPVMNHDSTQCSSSCAMLYNVTIASSFLGDSLKVIDMSTGMLLHAYANTTGANPWTLVASANLYGPLTVSDDYTYWGYAYFNGPTVKMISGTDTIYNILNDDSLAVTNPCLYALASGKVYVDNNNDCVFNTGDVPLNGVAVFSAETTTAPIWVGIGATEFTNTSGNYSTRLSISWLDTIRTSLPAYYDFIFPPSTCSPVTYVYTSLPQANIDFPVHCMGNVDVECWAGSPANVRPLMPFYMQPYVANAGCDTISGTLTFVKDSRVTYDASLSYNPAVSVSGDTLIWYYYNITNLSGGAYWNDFMSNIHLTPISTVAIGDTLCFHVFTGTPASDIDPLNNDFTICIPVVASYDPNIKEVIPKGIGATGDIPSTTPELDYTIHFQNTGTAAAYNISVIDTLDGDLDIASLKVLGASHIMDPMWIAPGVVKFNFFGINLPDSNTDEMASHGWVRFSAKLRSGLPAGTQIKNKGYIYFDSNPAVITNQALNTIIHTAGVNNVAAVQDVKIYPNPATNNIFVENLQNGQLSIVGISGSVVFNQNITNNKTEIDISRLPAGVYIVKTISKDGATTRKFVKE